MQSVTDEDLDTSNDRLRQGLARIRSRVSPADVPVEGRLVRMVGMTLEAKGCSAPIGGQCDIVGSDGAVVRAEVVGFTDERLLLMPIGSQQGISPGSRVIPRRGENAVDVSDKLLGRVLDGEGRPLDGLGEIVPTSQMPMVAAPLNPLARKSVVHPLDVGIRAINGLLTVGEGQSMGLFAGSGVGKSTLLGAITRNTTADVVVVALIGERGREVKDFVDDVADRAQQSVIVATPADASPVMRVHGALRATAIAEYFRDRGKRVLLLMDSLTRFAQAQREIALSIGEFPVAKGYSPSVFAMLPSLIERVGCNEVGSITGIYTVLVEGDDLNDPIADASRAILDGHIVLSRAIADAGIYPAIDVSASISRTMPAVAPPEQVQQARTFKQLFATFEENKDLIAVGAYQPGTDPAIDQAIAMRPVLRHFIAQSEHEREDMAGSVNALAAVSRLTEGGVQTGVEHATH